MITNKLDDLHASVNDIYTQWDEGDIEYNEATQILHRCCDEFTNGLVQPNRLEHQIRFDDVDSMVLWLLDNDLDTTPVTLTIHLGK
jgi:hypothetical protein